MSDTLDDYRKAYLLLQLLGAEDRRMAKGEANKLITSGLNRKALDLPNTKRINPLRESLCPHYIRKSRGRTPKGGTADFYELTEEGLAHLLNLRQYPRPLTVPGLAITRLVEQARAGGGPREAEGVPSIDEIFELCRELRRGRFADREYVPVHALRAECASRYGARAAGHEVLDARLLELWRSMRRMRLLPISNPRDVAREELEASIPDERGTLFYIDLDI